jgi:hypothetical protein
MHVIQIAQAEMNVLWKLPRGSTNTRYNVSRDLVSRDLVSRDLSKYMLFRADWRRKREV